MANVMFKRGLQTSLPTTAQDGVFYLTTDTNRLYVGQGNDKAPQLLNQTVQIVANVASLPTNPIKNDFYYCTAENILAVYTGTGAYNKDNWKQINPDTNTNNDTRISSGSFGEVDKTTENQLKYTLTLKQKTTDVITGVDGEETTAITATLALTAEDLESILHDQANVGLAVESGTNSVTVKTQGTGANTNQSVNIKGGNNTSVALNGTTITVDAVDSTYDLSALSNDGVATVRLHSKNDGANDDVLFKAGADLTVSAKENEITYEHATITRADDTAVSPEVLNTNSVIDVITGITSDNGHITKVTTKKYQMPAEAQDTKIENVTGTGDTDWQVTIVQTNGQNKVIDFSTDAANLQSDLEEKIAEGLAAANTALTYKGTIGQYEDLAAKDPVEIGDVWLLNAADDIYKNGDMFIATVASDEDHIGGIISEGKVVWTYVPSGDDLNTDTFFYGDVTVTGGSDVGGNIKYIMKASAYADGTTAAMPSGNEELKISGGTDILITSDNEKGGIISHKAYGTVTPTSGGTVTGENAFTAVTGVNLTNGHVTGLTTQTFSPITYDLTTGTNNAIVLKDNKGIEDAIEVSGDTWISATVANDKFSIAHANAQTTGGTTKSVNNAATLTHGGDLEILTGVTYDAKGHVSSVTTGKVTLPTDNNTTYDMFVGNSKSASSAVTAATANPYVVLRNNGGQNDTIQLKGDSGSLEVSGNASAVTISMVWGSF